MDKETVVTGMALRKQFGPQALWVLENYLEKIPQPKKRGVKPKFKLKKPLPSKDDYNALLAQKFTVSVGSLLSEAFSDISDLIEELQAWYDGMPESFQSGSKADQLQEAIDALEGIQQPELPEFFNDSQTLVYLPAENTTSRASRRDEATDKLQAVADFLTEEIEEESYTEEQKEEMQTVIDDIENSITEAQEVEFPTIGS